MIQESQVVNWLIQNTIATSGFIEWEREDAGQYVASVVRSDLQINLALKLLGSRTGSKVALELYIKKSSKVAIIEPSPFFRKYDSDDEKELAEALKQLYKTVAHQHANRELKQMDNEKECKQIIFKALLAG